MKTTLTEESIKDAPSLSTIHLCCNCNQPASDKFCGNCGQPQTVMRITFKTLAADLYDRLLAMDNKFARTTIYLVKNPGYLINEFLLGNRVRFFGAAGYYFILITLYLLLMSIFDVSLHEITAATTEEAVFNSEVSQQQLEFGRKMNDIIFNNFRIFGFMMVPFFTMVLMMLYRKAKLNFFEHSVVVLYSLSFGMLFSILALFVYVITGYNSQMIVAIVGVLFYGYIISSFYHKKNKVKGFFKGIIAYLLGYLFFLITLMLVIAAAVIADPSIIGM